MTTKEYLEIKKKSPDAEYNTYEGWEADLEKIIEFNKDLVEKYPWLTPRNRWTDKTPETYDYSYTELDAMPDGWRIAFGDQMVEEINNELKKFNFIDKYRIIQIKEKWGGLRWYDDGYPGDSKIGDIVSHYEKLSFKTCLICGKPAEWMSKGWISPYCTDCANKMLDCEYEDYKKSWKDEPEKLAKLERRTLEKSFTKIEEALT